MNPGKTTVKFVMFDFSILLEIEELTDNMFCICYVRKIFVVQQKIREQKVQNWVTNKIEET